MFKDKTTTSETALQDEGGDLLPRRLDEVQRGDDDAPVLLQRARHPGAWCQGKANVAEATGQEDVPALRQSENPQALLHPPHGVAGQAAQRAK